MRDGWSKTGCPHKLVLSEKLGMIGWFVLRVGKHLYLP